MKNFDNSIIYSNFKNIFGKEAAYYFSAPGRSEIGGNHTDHQHGKVLAAAINLDTRAAVCPNGSDTINVYSEGHSLKSIKLDALDMIPEERNRSISLIKGVVAAFAGFMPGMDIQSGKLQGFDAYVQSDVLPGSGLSSSASYEVLIAAIVNELGGFKKTAPQLAKIARFAENSYFGKPCGLMDQMACAVGNMIFIDFKSDDPEIKAVPFDFSDCGYSLCVINCGADHADLTAEYAAIPQELGEISSFFGKKVLRELDEAEFYVNLAELRKLYGDRAVLRAIHIFEENKRVDAEMSALSEGDFNKFLGFVRDSGNSSYKYLQNVIVCGEKKHQELGIALALAEKFLGGRGACRIQGGGFAGTIEAFVPLDITDKFKASMEAALGENSCRVLSIRSEGVICKKLQPRD